MYWGGWYLSTKISKEFTMLCSIIYAFLFIGGSSIFSYFSFQLFFLFLNHIQLVTYNHSKSYFYFIYFYPFYFLIVLSSYMYNIIIRSKSLPSINFPKYIHPYIINQQLALKPNQITLHLMILHVYFEPWDKAIISHNIGGFRVSN